MYDLWQHFTSASKPKLASFSLEGPKEAGYLSGRFPPTYECVKMPKKDKRRHAEQSQKVLRTQLMKYTIEKSFKSS